MKSRFHDCCKLHTKTKTLKRNFLLKSYTKAIEENSNQTELKKQLSECKARVLHLFHCILTLLIIYSKNGEGLTEIKIVSPRSIKGSTIETEKVETQEIKVKNHHSARKKSEPKDFAVSSSPPKVDMHLAKPRHKTRRSSTSPRSSSHIIPSLSPPLVQILFHWQSTHNYTKRLYSHLFISNLVCRDVHLRDSVITKFGTYLHITAAEHTARTKTVWGTPNIFWEDEFAFEIKEYQLLSNIVIRSVSLSQWLAKDKVMGKVDIPFDDLRDCNQVEKTYPFKAVAHKSNEWSGDLEMDIHYILRPTENDKGYLRIFIARGRNIPTSHSPYLKLIHGSQRFSTKTLKTHSNDEWKIDESFNLCFTKAEEIQPIKIHLLTRNILGKPEIVGTITVNINDLALTDNRQLESPRESQERKWEWCSFTTPEDKPTIEETNGELQLVLKYTEQILLPLPMYFDLVSLLVSPQYLPIIISWFYIAKTSSYDLLAKNLVYIFYALGNTILVQPPSSPRRSQKLDQPVNNYLVQFLDSALAAELKRQSLDTLFRESTFSTKSMECFLHTVGYTYLRNTLKHVLNEIVTTKSKVIRKSAHSEPITDQKKQLLEELTIKGRKNSTGSASPRDSGFSEQYIRYLSGVVSKLIGAIFDSLPNMPSLFFVAFKNLVERVKEKWGDVPNLQAVCRQSVASFLFLRFLLPVIVSPKSFDMVDLQPSEKKAKTLTYAAKIIQNSCNEVKFGDKDPSLSVFNIILKELQMSKQMNQFLESCYTTPTGEQGQGTLGTQYNEFTTDRIDLQKELGMISQELMAYISILKQKSISIDEKMYPLLMKALEHIEQNSLQRTAMLVQTTWRGLKDQAKEEMFVEAFYDNLFEQDPSLRKMFKSDFEKQKRSLGMMLEWIINHLNRLGELKPSIVALAKRHVRYGVKDEHYNMVGNALLFAFDKCLGAGFTAEVKEGWQTMYQLLSHTIMTASKQ